MSRRAIVTRYDSTQTVYNFDRANITDEVMLAHIASCPNQHLVKTIDLCTVDNTFVNAPAIVTWLKTVERLKG